MLDVVVAETMRDDHPVKAGSEYLASFQARGRGGELNLYLKVHCHLKEVEADAREVMAEVWGPEGEEQQAVLS